MIVGKQVVTPDASIASSACSREFWVMPGVLKSTPPKPLTYKSTNPGVFTHFFALFKIAISDSSAIRISIIGM
tara:strand:- start:304 stop:522 length:219 start_codon:yes stop_codon:yes gene_type:complete